nr:uncharacterized protein LOC129428976 [Misgurnus anguillicaudatus]
MPNGKAESKSAANVTPAHANMDHDYTPMDATTSSRTKRKVSPGTPTESTAPPSKVKSSQDSFDVPNASLVEAIEKLTFKIDSFGDQLRENSVMVASITKLVELNAIEIKECKDKIQAVEKEVPRIVKENKELKERVNELERYRRRWNLKIHGLKEKDDENIRVVVMRILSKLAPQWETSMESIVDSVHRIGRKEEGRDRQTIIQFTMRFHRDSFWKLSKNSRICKDLGIHFKQDFSKADREARAAAWPKMEQARAAGQNVFYKGHVGYINGLDPQNR